MVIHVMNTANPYMEKIMNEFLDRKEVNKC